MIIPTRPNRWIRKRKRTNPSISKDAKEFLNKGLAWDKQGKYDEAIEDYNKAIKINPNFASAYFYKGLAQYNKGELKTALHDFQKALNLDPENAEYKKIVSSLNAKLNQDSASPGRTMGPDAGYQYPSA